MIRKAALSLFKEDTPGTPYLAKPFLNINFLNEEELPFWLTDEKHIKKCNSIFNSKIVAYPVYVAQTIHKYKPSAVPQYSTAFFFFFFTCAKIPYFSPLTTQGRTRHLFIFNLLNHLSIVDLPGYGFAKVAKDMRDNWSILIEEYLNRAVNLKRALCLIECTEFFTPHDFVLLDMLITKGVPFQIVVTKVDRLRAPELHKLMFRVLSVIDDYKRKVKSLNERTHKEKTYDMRISSYLFNVSSLKNFGVQQLRAHLGLIATDNMLVKK
ncbi:hypothetical protein C922_01276 [Plasmodium inui San Antonio 1]|uniref:EngB-type G domain-containing protein n=1 Tax=Plasmodium inui San Antonio 1 TaxID=1237626 RepID=W7A575_9APIC|nr:hypothetical protein C922_01276 [Plasmodium inui San Antonio 1]EUD68257.1 hypothetical protein C922_01276 [Plasmodium inui San Antonio 1]